MAKVDLNSVMKVIDEMIDGASVRSLCRKYELNNGDFWRFLQKHDDIHSQYTISREIQMSVMADDLLDLTDLQVKKDDDGRYSNALVQHRRIQVDTRKWLLSKVLPKIYADKNKDDKTQEDAQVEI
jgi:hypothetical protein